MRSIPSLGLHKLMLFYRDVSKRNMNSCTVRTVVEVNLFLLSQDVDVVGVVYRVREVVRVKKLRKSSLRSSLSDEPLVPPDLDHA